MTLNLCVPEKADLKPRITVFGVGGAGGNAVNNMIDRELEGVDFVVANTDAQALRSSKAITKIQLGELITEGLGSGAQASVGAQAAEESIETIVDHLVGSHMCFITAGMGGGTGTGAAPIVGQAARELGILTVGVVTKPFQFEGGRRMVQAEEGVIALQKVVDTLIIIPNQNLFRIANEQTTFTEAFSLADDVLYQGVKGVTDLMVRPGIINLDFADIRSVMNEMGKAMMGTGEASGEGRAIQAADKAIANPLLDEISLKGANGVLINVTGGHDMTLFELDEAANRIRSEVDQGANIIVGSTLDPTLEEVIRVSVVATGIDALEGASGISVPRRSLKAPLPQTSALPPVQPPEHEVAQPVEIETGPAETDHSLFEQPTAAQVEAPEGAAVEQQGADGLPAPVYQPQLGSIESVDAEENFFDERTEFVAPQPTRPGVPSKETLARRDAAVLNVPSGEKIQEESQSSFSKEAQTEKPKASRLNSLISRMTGLSDAQETAPREQPPLTTRTAEPPPVEEAKDPEEERIEIPAFLRRQAN